MPGPKPTPTASLAARGSWRAATRADEPTPEAATAVDAPADLPESAAAYWRAQAPGLMTAGILTAADTATFARYCRVRAAWDDAMATVENGGDRWDMIGLAKLDDMLRRLEANYGMTPADRTTIRVAPAAEPAGKSRFFGVA